MRFLNAQHAEDKGRQRIDEILIKAGWVVQDFKQANTCFTNGRDPDPVAYNAFVSIGI